MNNLKYSFCFPHLFWISKKTFASAVDKCLETEEWVQKKIEGEITYHSPCCEDFVNIFLETIEELVLVGCS